MDDTAYREFFELPTQTYHRRYEALRAVFVDQRSQKEVADEFQFTYGSMRQLVREFRRACHTENERTNQNGERVFEFESAAFVEMRGK